MHLPEVTRFTISSSLTIVAKVLMQFKNDIQLEYRIITSINSFVFKFKFSNVVLILTFKKDKVYYGAQ